MAKLNKARAGTNTNRTYEGAPALPTARPERELRRAVASCLLWESNFYESGEDIAARIHKLAAQCKPEFVSALAVEARDQFRLRHAPLWLVTSLLRPDLPAGNSAYVRAGISGAIKRADEPGEILAMYRKAFPSAKRTFPRALKQGVGEAFRQFDAYALGKYNRDSEFRLRDVLRICHPQPRDAEQAALWKQVLDGTLPSPDTWEVALSGGADKRETFTRLIAEGKLGYMALLRNLRKMTEVGVDHTIIRDAILARKGARNVLPFRYVAAARAAPGFEPALDEALCAAVEALPQFQGMTLFLVDVSGSMDAKLSGKSDLTRMDAAATLASIWPGQRRVFSFSNYTKEVPPRAGMAGAEAIVRSQGHGGTMLGQALRDVAHIPHDRVVVITDEQSHDAVGGPAAGKAYMINVAGYRNEVGYGAWTRISGFSENVLRFIAEHENYNADQ